MQHRFHAAIAALTLTPFAALAADAPSGPPPIPAELAQLDYFVGTWQCSGKAFASPMVAEHATTATLHVTRGVGGRWLHLAYDENKTAANPGPVHAALYWGYDSGKKEFVQRCFDSFGGYCNQSSKGWNADTLGFEGTGNDDGQQFGARDTVVRKGPAELVHTGEMQGEDKKWMKIDEETCRKGK